MDVKLSSDWRVVAGTDKIRLLKHEERDDYELERRNGADLLGEPRWERVNWSINEKPVFKELVKLIRDLQSHVPLLD